MVMIILNFLIMSILSMMILMIKFNQKKNISQLSAFECGFEPKFKSRNYVSIRFFMLIIIFLIFDIEISLIMPLPFILKFSHFSFYFVLILMVVTILLLGVIHELNEGSLEWIK